MPTLPSPGGRQLTHYLHHCPSPWHLGPASSLAPPSFVLSQTHTPFITAPGDLFSNCLHLVTSLLKASRSSCIYIKPRFLPGLGASCALPPTQPLPSRLQARSLIPQVWARSHLKGPLNPSSRAPPRSPSRLIPARLTPGSQSLASCPSPPGTELPTAWNVFTPHCH